MVDKITIVGTGLIGGSFALALKAAGFTGEIFAYGRDESRLMMAKRLGVVDAWSVDAKEAVTGADVVFLSVPMGAMRAVLKQIAPYLAEQCIVTDAGSVKGCFVDDVRAVLPSLRYVVPGHPIAGTEKSGVEAAFPTLYNDRRVILTPLDETDVAAIDLVDQLWSMTGANVERMQVDHHDRVLAATSHLPHVLAFSLVDTLATMQEREEIFRYAAGGFRDFTRIASSDPVMWRDICSKNSQALLPVLDELREHLDRLHEAIAAQDEEALFDVMTRAKAARDEFCG